MAVFIDSAGRFHHDQDAGLALNCPHCQVLAHITPVSVPDFNVLQQHKPAQVGLVYRCEACNAPIFSSNDKVMANDFPTFRGPISRKAIGLSTDFKIVLPRTEVHCANCGGHLGYRSSADNAAETWRYAINGTSLRFALN